MMEMTNTTRRAFVQTAALSGAVAGASVMGLGGKSQAVAEVAPLVLADGTYAASAMGFAGDVTVTIEILAGEVASVVVDGPAETPERGGKAADVLSASILEVGGTEGVDVVSGSTMTSNAVLSAADDCLSQAAGKAADELPAVVMKPGVYVGEGMGFNWFEPVRVKIEVDETTLLSFSSQSRTA